MGSIHGAPTRLLNGNGNIRSAASDKTCVAAESVQGFNIFQQGRGVNDFAVYPNHQPILNYTKPVSTTTMYLNLNLQFDFEQKLSQNVTTLELYLKNKLKKSTCPKKKKKKTHTKKKKKKKKKKKS